MELKKINERATEERVRRFFKNDFKRWMLLSGTSLADLQSPSINDMPTSPSYGNSNEEKLAATIDAKKIVAEVVRVVNSLETRQRKTITLHHLQGRDVAEVSVAIQRTDRQCHRILNKAYIQFAYGYQIESLLVYRDVVVS